MKFLDIQIIAAVTGYMDRLIIEAVKVELPRQYEQGGWPYFERVMENSLSSPQRQ
jgi:hypothetical protein